MVRVRSRQHLFALEYVGQHFSIPADDRIGNTDHIIATGLSLALGRLDIQTATTSWCCYRRLGRDCRDVCARMSWEVGRRSDRGRDPALCHYPSWQPWLGHPVSDSLEQRLHCACCALLMAGGQADAAPYDDTLMWRSGPASSRLRYNKQL